jgi:hypothetical protein
LGRQYHPGNGSQEDDTSASSAGNCKSSPHSLHFDTCLGPRPLPPWPSPSSHSQPKTSLQSLEDVGSYEFLACWSGFQSYEAYGDGPSSHHSALKSAIVLPTATPAAIMSRSIMIRGGRDGLLMSVEVGMVLEDVESMQEEWELACNVWQRRWNLKMGRVSGLSGVAQGNKRYPLTQRSFSYN